MVVGKQKKWYFSLCIAFVFAFLLAGCSSGKDTSTQGADTGKKAANDGGDQKVTLTVMTNIIGVQYQELKDIAVRFMKKNPNIKVNISSPGAEYENLMKVKMASHDMPDVFSTHGWAKKRYGSFLADLSGEPWASKLSQGIKPQVTDGSGKVYVLPMDQDTAGIVYNVDVLKKYNIAVPKTWDEFLAACQTISDKSNGKIAPIHIGGSDSWTMGQFFDYFAIPQLISPKNNQVQALKNQTFDWSNWTPLAQKFLDLQKKGYLNKDVLTSKYTDSTDALANGKAAFVFYPSAAINQAKKTNPNVNLGLMPIPATKSGDQSSFIGGEKTTWGIWKDTKHMEAAKKFVDFYAKPENIKAVAESNQLPAGLKGIKVDDGSLTKYYKKYSDIPVYPYFDRAYLPNGMWDVIVKNAQQLLSGAVTPSQFSKNMSQEYKRLSKK